MLIFIGLAAVGLIGFLFFMVYYNKFTRLRTQISEAFEGIVVQQQRRKEILPELSQLLSTYTPLLSSDLGELISELPAPQPGATYAEHAQQSEQFEEALNGLMRDAGQDQGLTKDAHFRNLSLTLKEIEKSEQMAKRYFNALVRDYNSLCETFPAVIAASMLGFKKQAWYGKEQRT